MSKKGFFAAAALTGAAVGAGFGLKDGIRDRVRRAASERKWQEKGDKAAQKLFGFFADRVSSNAIGGFYRPDYENFLEGSGYFLSDPKENAVWRIGYAKESILPAYAEGDFYLGGYLAYPPNKVSGAITDQLIRVTALDDGSGRGLHVFASIDCVGISNTDVREIRARLKKEIGDLNIESLNICATHCHSGVDTLGLWGDLKAALKTNPKAVKSRRTVNNAVSGKNKDFTEYLFLAAVCCIKTAIGNMAPGAAEFAVIDGSAFVHDKRPPYVVDPAVTVVRFRPQNAAPVYWVMMAAHPTCYGDSQREISADFPYYICKTLEDAGAEGVFFQGAEAAVATNRGPFAPLNATTHESVVSYGDAIGRKVLSVPDGEYKTVEPLLNVRLSPLMLPADNQLLLLAAKLKLINHKLSKFPAGDKKFTYCFHSEVGYAELGKELKLALIPGELMPEIEMGGACSADESWQGTDWNYPPLKEAVDGHLAVMGLCNDVVGYIVPDNDFGSVFAPLHYEEAVSPGRRTASNVTAAFLRTAAEADTIRL